MCDTVPFTARAQTPAQLQGYDHELTDLHEQLDRFFGLARLYYELTDDLMNGYLSLSAHRLNQIMQTLTVVSLILLVFHRRSWLGGRGRRR